MRSKRRSVLMLAFVLMSGLAASGETRAIEDGKAALRDRLLDRWQAISSELGVDSRIWRAQFGALVDAAPFKTIDAWAKIPPEGMSDARRLALYRTMQADFVRNAALALKSGTLLKLGTAVSDQTFVPITPCRIVDTRNVGGLLSAGAARNFNFYAATGTFSWAAQGGAPGTAATACAGTVNPNGGAPSAAVATVTVVSPTAAGNFVAWGGANPVPLTSILNWNNPGDIAANTTVIPAGGRAGMGPGGAVQDFAVFYNGPSGAAHVIVDVVGYFTENAATALDCHVTTPLPLTVNTTTDVYIGANACDTGYRVVASSCATSGASQSVSLNTVATDTSANFGSCDWFHTGTPSVTLFASSVCCRLPGR
jgi:hypothetical protein